MKTGLGLGLYVGRRVIAVITKSKLLLSGDESDGDGRLMLADGSGAILLSEA